MCRVPSWRTASSSQGSARGKASATVSSTSSACSERAGGAREDGVPHRRRHAGLTGGEHLGDEERVPARARVQVGGVDLVSDRELPDGGGRERFQREPVDGGRRREVAERARASDDRGGGRRRDRCR